MGAMPTPWQWLKIDGWKSHAVPEYLVAALTDDLNARSLMDGTQEPVVWEAEHVQRVSIDEPGMSFADMPTMEFRLDGLTVEIPTHDVGVMFGQLRRAKRRTFKHGTSVYVGTDYYKLHGFCKCIVLTPDMYVDLVGQLEAKVNEADAIATACVRGAYARDIKEHA